MSNTRGHFSKRYRTCCASVTAKIRRRTRRKSGWRLSRWWLAHRVTPFSWVTPRPSFNRSIRAEGNFKRRWGRKEGACVSWGIHSILKQSFHLSIKYHLLINPTDTLSCTHSFAQWSWGVRDAKSRFCREINRNVTITLKLALNGFPGLQDIYGESSIHSMKHFIFRPHLPQSILTFSQSQVFLSFLDGVSDV